MGLLNSSIAEFSGIHSKQTELLRIRDRQNTPACFVLYFNDP